MGRYAVLTPGVRQGGERPGSGWKAKAAPAALVLVLAGAIYALLDVPGSPPAPAPPEAPGRAPSARPVRSPSPPTAGVSAPPATGPPRAEALAAPPAPAPPTGAGDLAARLRAAVAAKGPGYRPRTRHTKPDGTARFTNRLIFETSPYLLQHAHNPVDWNPWGDEAFARARALGRPVLLSVGYATCHWCHVMEEESFEDLEIAAFLNAHFVCVKVDREERPDVDAIYMDAVNLLHGRGGWPMTIVMTPDRRPFFAGTYFPPRDGARGARKGFLTILRELAQRYRTDREGLVREAGRVTQRLVQAAEPRPAGGIPTAAAIDATVRRTLSALDPVNGGFGRRPKFPRPALLDLLLRFHRRTRSPDALHAVVLTLDKMAAGGIRDHVGGGFHRYSVDDRWLVPHFEKMLYDNAQLASTYLAAFQVTGEARFADVATEVLDYVAREMVDPIGAFRSATDADSEGEEGRFFVWTEAELTGILGAERARIAKAWFAVQPGGNFEGRSILHTPRPEAEVARTLGIAPADLRAEIGRARAQLYAVRQKRPPPLTDDKVIVAWNGLMISAFAQAALVLDRADYTQVAVRGAEALLLRARTQGRLHRTVRAGVARHAGVLSDYAFLAQGLLDLMETTGDPRWLTEALSLHEILAAHFEDGAHGGFYRTADDAERLLVRSKPDYDGAEPSGNSIAARNLLRLAELTSDERWRGAAERTLRQLAERMTRAGGAVPAALGALDMLLDDVREVVLVGAPDDPDARALTAVVRRTFLPNRALVRLRGGPAAAAMSARVPLALGKVPRGGRSTAYVCRRGVCERPTTDPATLTLQLAPVRPYALDPKPAGP